MVYISATLVLVLAFCFGGYVALFTFVALELLFGIWLDQLVAVPFAIAARN